MNKIITPGGQKYTLSHKIQQSCQVEAQTANLLSTDTVKPLSPSASITTNGEDPGTAIGLDEVPGRKCSQQSRINERIGSAAVECMNQFLKNLVSWNSRFLKPIFF